MNHGPQSLDALYIQNLRRQTKQPTHICCLCPDGFPNPSALFAHVERDHEADLQALRRDSNFDEAMWRDQFKARAADAASRQRRRAETQTSTPAPPEPSSANSSQDLLGIQRLSLATTEFSKKRSSPTRKTELSPGEDPTGPRMGVKRTKTKTFETSSPDQSSRQPSARPPRRGRKDGNQRSARVVPEPRDAHAQRRNQRSQQHFSGSANTQAPRRAPAAQPAADTPATTGTASATESSVIEMPIDPRFPELYLQPDSRPISLEQLAAEVKSIYSGLTMVEAKCIHVDKAQAAAIRSAERGDTELADDHWRALIALHRTLLHEHHDFFLATQHPSASPALRRLAAKYSMPARMWKHGIHAFLELLRYRLPDSLEYMISFIYFAYQMMSLLYETVPTFEDTWIECLGDLGRYRMAIEDEDFRDRETWAGVARFWYTKAADRSPGVGRLYHHLAILARPDALQQLYLYCRSLTCVQPFQSARESIMTLFDPVMGSADTSTLPISRIDTFYIKLHSILFSRTRFEDFDAVLGNFIQLLDGHITRCGTKWRDEGAYIAISTIAALFEYGSPDSVFRKLVEHGNFRSRRQGQSLEADNTRGGSANSSPSPEPGLDDIVSPDPLSRLAFGYALKLLFLVTKLTLRRKGDKDIPVDKNVLLYVNLVLTLLVTLAPVQSFNFPFTETYVDGVFDSIPWEDLCVFANTLVKTDDFDTRYENTPFLRPEKGDIGPLPEDFLVSGQAWTQCSYPVDWFKLDEIGDEERLIEHASTMRMRCERVFWNLCRLAEHSKWIVYERSSKTWKTIPRRQGNIRRQISPEASEALTDITHEDIDMDDQPESEGYIGEHSACSDISVDDSPEMLKLQQADRQHTEQQQIAKNAGHDSSRLSPPSSDLGPAKAAEEIMQSGFTVMVPDLNLLLNQQDLFKILTDRGWSIVISGGDVTVLLQVSGSKDPKRFAADAALGKIRTAISNGKDIRILAEDGTDITETALDREPGRDGSSAKGDKDDTLITVTRVASDLSSRGMSNRTSKQAKPALLVTESRATRLKAKYQGVAAIATSMLRSVLLASITRRRSPSASSMGRHSPLGSEMEI